MFIYSSNTGVKSHEKPSKTRLKKVTKDQQGAKKSPFVSHNVDVQVKQKVNERAFAENLNLGAETDSKTEKKPIFNYIQVILFAVIVGALGFMYLAHVRKTTQLFEERNNLLLQFESTQHRVEELQRNYERIISPSEIHERANRAGFEAPKANDLYIKK